MSSTESSKLTAADIFLYLRQHLLDAREQNDSKVLVEIQTICDFLSGLAYSKKIRGLGAILEEFESSARDSITGVSWKSTIPSEEEIRSVLAEEIDQP